VTQVLDGENVHLSAESIFGQAKKELPEISMATVYNTLNELVAMGEVLEVAAGSGPKRYDPNVKVAHHHLVCTSCGALHDVITPEPEMTLGESDLHGYVVTGMDVVFQGLCRSCQHTSSTRA
jgi:Fur family ferric uptake transcriptional regulator